MIYNHLFPHTSLALVSTESPEFKELYMRFLPRAEASCSEREREVAAHRAHEVLSHNTEGKAAGFDLQSLAKTLTNEWEARKRTVAEEMAKSGLEASSIDYQRMQYRLLRDALAAHQDSGIDRFFHSFCPDGSVSDAERAMANWNSEFLGKHETYCMPYATSFSNLSLFGNMIVSAMGREEVQELVYSSHIERLLISFAVMSTPVVAADPSALNLHGLLCSEPGIGKSSVVLGAHKRYIPGTVHVSVGSSAKAELVANNNTMNMTTRIMEEAPPGLFGIGKGTTTNLRGQNSASDQANTDSAALLRNILTSREISYSRNERLESGEFVKRTITIAVCMTMIVCTNSDPSDLARNMASRMFALCFRSTARPDISFAATITRKLTDKQKEQRELATERWRRDQLLIYVLSMWMMLGLIPRPEMTAADGFLVAVQQMCYRDGMQGAMEPRPMQRARTLATVLCLWESVHSVCDSKMRVMDESEPWDWKKFRSAMHRLVVRPEHMIFAITVLSADSEDPANKDIAMCFSHFFELDGSLRPSSGHSLSREHRLAEKKAEADTLRRKMLRDITERKKRKERKELKEGPMRRSLLGLQLPLVGLSASGGGGGGGGAGGSLDMLSDAGDVVSEAERKRVDRMVEKVVFGSSDGSMRLLSREEVEGLVADTRIQVDIDEDRFHYVSWSDDNIVSHGLVTDAGRTKKLAGMLHSQLKLRQYPLVRVETIITGWRGARTILDGGKSYACFEFHVNPADHRCKFLSISKSFLAGQCNSLFEQCIQKVIDSHGFPQEVYVLGRPEAEELPYKVAVMIRTKMSDERRRDFYVMKQDIESTSIGSILERLTRPTLRSTPLDGSASSSRAPSTPRAAALAAAAEQKRTKDLSDFVYNAVTRGCKWWVLRPGQDLLMHAIAQHSQRCFGQLEDDPLWYKSTESALQFYDYKNHGDPESSCLVYPDFFEPIKYSPDQRDFQYHKKHAPTANIAGPALMHHMVSGLAIGGVTSATAGSLFGDSEFEKLHSEVPDPREVPKEDVERVAAMLRRDVEIEEEESLEASLAASRATGASDMGLGEEGAAAATATDHEEGEDRAFSAFENPLLFMQRMRTAEEKESKEEKKSSWGGFSSRSLPSSRSATASASPPPPTAPAAAPEPEAAAASPPPSSLGARFSLRMRTAAIGDGVPVDTPPTLPLLSGGGGGPTARRRASDENAGRSSPKRARVEQNPSESDVLSL